MTDSEPKTETKPAPKAVEKPPLGRAGASGDAGVHILLAHRSIHASNGDAEKVAEIDRQLEELGLTAQ